MDDPERPRRLGIFGGTFDPPHIGHMIVAQDVLEALDLDRMLFIPAATPPHKTPGAQVEGALRLEMTESALGGDPRFAVSDLEFQREGPSWSVDTLRKLREEFPDTELFFVIGADQLAGFAQWKEPAEVARLARLVVMGRAGEGPLEAPVEGVEHDFVAVTRIDISSSAIREKISRGGSARHLVPEPVRRIIEAHKLYS